MGGDLTHLCQVTIAPDQPPVMWREVMAVFGSSCFCFMVTVCFSFKGCFMATFGGFITAFFDL